MPDFADEFRERVRSWLKQVLNKTAHWATTEGIRLAKKGAKQSAEHLERAARDFRLGQRDKGLHQLKQAEREAHSEGQPQAASEIRQVAKQVEEIDSIAARQS